MSQYESGGTRCPRYFPLLCWSIHPYQTLCLFNALIWANMSQGGTRCPRYLPLLRWSIHPYQTLCLFNAWIWANMSQGAPDVQDTFLFFVDSSIHVDPSIHTRRCACLMLWYEGKNFVSSGHICDIFCLAQPKSVYWWDKTMYASSDK